MVGVVIVVVEVLVAVVLVVEAVVAVVVLALRVVIVENSIHFCGRECNAETINNGKKQKNPSNIIYKSWTLQRRNNCA